MGGGSRTTLATHAARKKNLGNLVAFIRRYGQITYFGSDSSDTTGNAATLRRALVPTDLTSFPAKNDGFDIQVKQQINRPEDANYKEIDLSYSGANKLAISSPAEQSVALYNEKVLEQAILHKAECPFSTVAIILLLPLFLGVMLQFLTYAVP